MKYGGAEQFNLNNAQGLDTPEAIFDAYIGGERELGNDDYWTESRKTLLGKKLLSLEDEGVEEFDGVKISVIKRDLRFANMEADKKDNEKFFG